MDKQLSCAGGAQHGAHGRETRGNIAGGISRDRGKGALSSHIAPGFPAIVTTSFR